MDAVAEFGALVAAGGRPLDRALALVASVGRPEVDAGALVARMDELAADLPGTDAAGLCAAVFRGLGFTGNRDDYYDPDNSLLDRVLDRRTGIPITLSVLAMELGRRRGVDLVGVGMPGHFLLRAADDPDLFLDAFDGGRVLDADGCRSLFARMHGGSTPFTDEYLTPSEPAEIVVRVLNNLRAARLRRGDRQGLADVLRLQAVLPGAGIAERRQLAGVLAAEGRFLEAADLYDGLTDDDEARADEHRAAAVRLRANLN
ncbi:SirB1 family protein [Dermatobacter hominis]|uniref:SirB1 family protein n=1 Tax=Dermatobacter hominis TaxID=2884263 RepID=UPI001D11EBF9|nr:transglutaminase-like domain-containing protein [Dermatobacter hominis]UDY36441.1 transglutaminase-like domain-containing protein [Dermatobacter hominis]